MTRFVRYIAISTALLAVSVFLNAQEFRGTLSGSVTDPTGAQVANAKVVIVESHTGTTIESVSDSAGSYTIPFLLPGDYDITVTKEGFKAAVHKSVHVG